MFKVESQKNKTFIVYHTKYRFKEEWLLQVARIGVKNAMEFFSFLDEHFGEKVRVYREWYTCDIDKSFEGTAGLKLEFLDRKSANKYCDMLNELGSK